METRELMPLNGDEAVAIINRTHRYVEMKLGIRVYGRRLNERPGK